jgi:hypothetical protein
MALASLTFMDLEELESDNDGAFFLSTLILEYATKATEKKTL